MIKSKIFATSILIALMLVFNGCEREMSLNPEPVNSNDNAASIQSKSAQDSEESADGYITTSEGQFKMLSVNPKFRREGQMNPVGDTLFSTSKYIDAEQGGWVAVGDWNYGFSSLNFTSGDLPESDTIHFEWAPQETLEGMLTGMEFGPHGTNFDSPVFLSISYKMANLDGVNENDLRFCYFNDQTGQWELIPCQVNKWFKVVTVYLNHFSRYALAHG